jgi:hypothetical protein
VVSPFSRKMVKDGTLATNGLITLLWSNASKGLFYTFHWPFKRKNCRW